jgi:hypothetical protein
MSRLMHGANVQIFGDPTTMSSMMQGFMRATGVGLASEGLLKALSPEARSVLAQLGLNVGEHFGLSGRAGSGAGPAHVPNPASGEALHREPATVAGTAADLSSAAAEAGRASDPPPSGKRIPK